MNENINIENTENNITETAEQVTETAEAVKDTAEAAAKETEAAESVKDTEENTEVEGEEKTSFLSDVLEIAESVFMSIFVVLLLFTFVARPVTVDGRSMYPTLNDKDKLIMNSLFCSPDPGDIVIIDNQKGHTLESDKETITTNDGLQKRIIKRVIAVEGQTVDLDFETHTVTVDGKVQDEPYIAEATTYDPGAFDYPVTVPEDYIFVMGDNRNNSTDSRDSHVGFVKKEDIMGEAVFRFYPFNDFGLI